MVEVFLLNIERGLWYDGRIGPSLSNPIRIVQFIFKSNLEASQDHSVHVFHKLHQLQHGATSIQNKLFVTHDGKQIQSQETSLTQTKHAGTRLSPLLLCDRIIMASSGVIN